LRKGINHFLSPELFAFSNIYSCILQIIKKGMVSTTYRKYKEKGSVVFPRVQKRILHTLRARSTRVAETAAFQRLAEQVILTFSS
jgi:hypothetical protein